MTKVNMNYITGIHPKGFALSLTAGAIYALCALVVVFWQDASMEIFRNWFHGIDLQQIAVPVQISFGSFLNGLVTLMLFSYAVGVLYAWIYNLCCEHCQKWDE